jgi:rhodanese-related sulfurtransferase
LISASQSSGIWIRLGLRVAEFLLKDRGSVLSGHQTVADLTIDDVRNGLASGTIVLVDVREANEFAAGHIPGSVLLPLSAFDASDLPRPDGRRIVLSCRSGRRSLTAAGMAHEQGISIDAHYAGGFIDWVAHGEPVETGLPGE